MFLTKWKIPPGCKTEFSLEVSNEWEWRIWDWGSQGQICNPTVMLAGLAVPIYFLNALMFHSTSPITAKSLRVNLLPLWLADFTAAVWPIWCLHAVQFSQDKSACLTVWCARSKNLPHLCLPLPLWSVFCPTASKSRAGGRIYQQHLV